MKFEKMIKSMAALSLSASLLVLGGCGESPENAFHKQQEVGYFEGMKITFISDDAADSPSKGLYVVDDVNISPDKKTTEDVKRANLVGKFEGNDLYWVSDSSSSPGKGFYLLKDQDDRVVPVVTMLVQAGKVRQSFGVVHRSNMESPIVSGACAINDSVGLVDKVKDMSAEELMEASRELKKLAQRKQLDAEYSVSPNGGFRP